MDRDEKGGEGGEGGEGGGGRGRTWGLRLRPLGSPVHFIQRYLERPFERQSAFQMPMPLTIAA
jgi:hypothetical protein